MKAIRAAILALALWSFLPASAPAARILVLPDGSGDYPEIQSALDAAATGDTVDLGDGTFSGQGNRDLDFRGKVVTLQSRSGNAEACVIQCGGSQSEPHRGFDFHSGEKVSSRVRSITITGANASDGAIVRCTGSSPSFAGCRFERSEAQHLGGGFYLHESSPEIEDCYFHFLSSDGGGALWCVRGQPVLRRCTVSVVNAPVGGAITGNDSRVTMTDCLLINPQGAIAGAILTQGGSVDLIGCTITDAVAEAGNAAVLAAGGRIRLDRCLITYTRDNASAVECTGGTVELTCCDLYGNALGDWTGCIADQYQKSGNFSADPLYCDRDQYDYSLHEGSPCLPGNNPGGQDCGLVGALGQGCGIVGVGRDLARAGAALEVWPNPFVNESRIRFVLPLAAADLAIYDVVGRRLRTLSRGEAAGAHELVWNGEDEAGIPAPAGVYFARLTVGRSALSRMLVRVSR